MNGLPSPTRIGEVEPMAVFPLLMLALCAVRSAEAGACRRLLSPSRG